MISKDNCLDYTREELLTLHPKKQPRIRGADEVQLVEDIDPFVNEGISAKSDQDWD